MGTWFEIKVILPFISSIISLVIIIYFILKGRKNKLLSSYVWCVVLAFIWSFGQFLQITQSKTVTLKFIFIVFQFGAISFLALSWLFFCLYYTNNKVADNKRLFILLAVLPVINYTALLTNNHHHLFYTHFDLEDQKNGLFFYLHTVVSYSYTLVAVVILIKHFLKVSGAAKKQTFILMLTGALPAIASCLHTFNVINVGFEPAPTSFSFSCLLVTIATFRYRFLNIVPIALRKTIDNLKEAVVVVDDDHKIVDFNRAFSETFSFNNQININDEISYFIINLQEKIFNLDAAVNIIKAMSGEGRPEFSGELILDIPARRCFIVNVRPISNKSNEVLGRIISFYDVTNYQDLLDDLNEKYIELSVMNERLKDYAATVAELAASKERNRLAKDVHDTLGQTLTLLIALLEVSSITCETNPATTKEKLLEALDISRAGLNEVRRSVSGLSSNGSSDNNLKMDLNNLILQYQIAGMQVDLESKGMENFKDPIIMGIIYRICQEALTNSLRHGKASKVNIILRFENKLIKLFIFDNGCGCKLIEKGLGLKGMEERLNSLHGTLVYGSDGESGFNIRAEIPLETA